MIDSDARHRRTGCRPLIEALEARRMLSSDTGFGVAPVTVPLTYSGHGPGCCCAGCTGGAVEARLQASQAFEPFRLRVNFQPESATTVPPGFRADIGREYHRRANGLTYGWSSPNETGARDRNSPRSVPLGEQYDTYTLTNGKSWSAAVPNGWYSVTLVAGDPDNINAWYKFEVEGERVMEAVPQNIYRWAEGQAVVQVTDGRLTVEGYEGAVANKLNFLYIDRVQAPVAPVNGPHLAFNADGSINQPEDRIEPGVLRIGNKVYIAGGFTNNYGGILNRFDVLDTSTGKMTRLADLPGAETHFGFSYDGRFIYKIAGQVGASTADRTDASTNESWKYDIEKDKWTRWFNLPEPRITLAVTYFNGRMHATGGADETGIVSKADHWMLDYNNAEAGWQRVAPLPRAADHVASLLADTPDGPRWIIIGGEHGHGVSYVQHDDVFAYDFATDTWERRSPMPEPGSHFEGNVFYYARRMWVLGARGNANTRLDNIWSYDLVNDRWATHGSLPQGRFGGASWALNDRLYFSMGDVFGESQFSTLSATLPASL